MNDTIQLDADEVLRRFAEEREKRLRPEGFGQYLRLTEDMDRDPWTERQERPPVADHVTFTFVGGGWAGLLTGAELAKRGIHDVRIIDRAGDFGGVWYWNRYPGVMCDSPAALYLPLLEETGHTPSMKYAFQPEILEHCQRIGRHFGLYDKALFHTSVERAEWDEAARLWRITTDRGDSFTSTYLSLGLGFFSTPKLPGIPGIETFKGKAFHAARWDYDYTGGSPADPRLDKLTDKRVAVIGTGATAIQCIGPVSETAKELYVFQRTPSAVSPRGNGPVDEAWFRSIATPGWQKRYHDAYVRDWTGLWGQPFSLEPSLDPLDDDFAKFAARLRSVILSVPAEIRNPVTVKAALDKASVEIVSEVHEYIRGMVSDPDTAEKLLPWYRPLCKRPTFNDDYLHAYNRPGTQLVDTDGKGVEAITETAVIANGTEHPVDCIIYASGFEFAKDPLRALKFEVLGVDGVDLRSHWAQGVRSLHGLHTRGFPNMFTVQLAQGADFAANVPTGWQDAGETIALIVDHMLQHGLTRVEVEEADELAWSQQIAATPPMPDTRDCTPGLLTFEGGTDPRIALLSGVPEGPRGFFAMMAGWKWSGDFAGLEFQQ